MAHISAVVPLYNEENCLDELYRRLSAALAAINPDYEIVLIDDGSRDRTWEGVAAIAGRDRRVRGLRLSRNFGQHYCITAGLDICDAEWVVIMDGDLQDRPEEIAKLYARAQEGFDVVLAQRGRRRHPLPARISSWLFSRVFNYLTGLRRDERVGTFRIVSRRVVENTRRMREQLRFLGGMLEWLGFPTTKLPVEHAPRAGGGSGYSFRKRWALARDAIVAYSDKPLRLTVRFGFLLAALSAAYGVYVIIRALSRRVPVAGWSSLIVSLFFLGGIIIAILGIVGIYLERTFAETKRRPLYIVRDRLNIAASDEEAQ
ncbi:MAG TPA: glycosyltransferase [candidate division WOR-3 bacterium]|uniref:Glycosyltransferase n=1 Tax=candidate division WOR-3 bacterium TaxID=2052148 RepID=A0A7V0T4D2_UNCW3|nr:glycosyltransferase [candidate division WOR-3 bacterium]